MKNVSEHMKLIDDNSVKMYLYLNIEKPGLDYTLDSRKRDEDTTSRIAANP